MCDSKLALDLTTSTKGRPSGRSFVLLRHLKNDGYRARVRLMQARVGREALNVIQ